MIQTALFFILGFLTAGFLALLVAPAIWRRAVVLTRRRVEASVPLSLEEIQADKDRLRAEFAMSVRRIEIRAKAAEDKAAARLIEIEKVRDEARLAREEHGAAQAEGTALGEEVARLKAEAEQAAKTISELEAARSDREKRLEEQATELKALGRMYDEASLDASARQIDMVSQETRIDKLNDEIQALKAERGKADQRVKDIAAEDKELRETLKTERRRIAALERQVERLTASLADREETLERRERQLARLRGQPGAEDGNDAETVRLEERLAFLTAENRRLREDYANGARPAEAEGDALLRENIHELAAEVVALVAQIEGEGSPIREALAKPGPRGAGGSMMSLADRIRALQKAAKA